MWADARCDNADYINSCLCTICVEGQGRQCCIAAQGIEDYDAPFECEHLIYTAKVPTALKPLITAFSPYGLFEATQEE